LSPYAQISRFSAVTPDFWNAQVGDFEVATSGGFWVAIRDILPPFHLFVLNGFL